MTAPDADGWIEWSGGECPVPARTLVETECGNGERDTDVAEYWCWDWLDSCPKSNIMRYHIVEPRP